MSALALNPAGIAELSDPAKFQVFVSGIVAAAVQQAASNQPAALPAPPVMLNQVLEVYERI